MRISRKGALYTIVLIASVVSLTVAGSSWAQKPEQQSLLDENKVIARVNGIDITQGNLKVAVNTILPLVTYHSSVSDERLKEIEKEALESLIHDELIYVEAKRKKIKASKKEIKKELNQLKKRVPRGQTLDEILKRSNMTVEDLKTDIAKAIVIRKFKKSRHEKFEKKAEKLVTLEYMKKYYKDNLKKFWEPEKVRISEILIKADPGGGRKGWEETKKKAVEVEKKAKAGVDFAELAREFSQDAYAQKGGDMGWAHIGSIAPELEAALATMKEGEISAPVMTIFGYHIIRLEERAPAHQKKFEDLNQEKLEWELRQKESKRMWNEWLAGLRKAADIEYLTKLD